MLDGFVPLAKRLANNLKKREGARPFEATVGAAGIQRVKS